MCLFDLALNNFAASSRRGKQRQSSSGCKGETRRRRRCATTTATFESCKRGRAHRSFARNELCARQASRCGGRRRRRRLGCVLRPTASCGGGATLVAARARPLQLRDRAARNERAASQTFARSKFTREKYRSAAANTFSCASAPPAACVRPPQP